MTDIHDHRPDHILLEFEPDLELAARIRERLPKHPQQFPPIESPAARAIRETEDALRAELEIEP